MAKMKIKKMMKVKKWESDDAEQERARKCDDSVEWNAKGRLHTKVHTAALTSERCRWLPHSVLQTVVTQHNISQ
jgi:hypothetical protein